MGCLRLWQWIVLVSVHPFGTESWVAVPLYWSGRCTVHRRAHDSRCSCDKAAALLFSYQVQPSTRICWRLGGMIEAEDIVKQPADVEIGRLDDDDKMTSDGFGDSDADADDPGFFELADDSIVPDAFNYTLPAISLNDLDFFSTNLSYFYLKNELNLSELALWKITFEAGSALEMSATTIRGKIDVLRETLDLNDADISSILEKQPTFLHLSATKNLAPTLLFLLRTLELGRDELRTLVLACPSILSYSIDNINAKVKFFTHLMGFSVLECRNLWVAEPNLLRASVRSGLVPKMRFLVRDMEIRLPQLRLIVKNHPRILLYSLDGNLIPKLIYYCIMTLDMTTGEVQNLLLKYPMILSYNLDRHLLPLTRYLLHDVGMSNVQVKSMLLRQGRIVTHALVKVKHVVGYLCYVLGLSSHQMQRILLRAPQVLGLDTERNLQSKVDFLQSEFGLDQEQLRTVIAAMPTLFNLNLDRNLVPKARLLQQAFADEPEQLTTALVRFPALLGYSLEQRIAPRLKAIQKAGLDSASLTIGLPMTQDKFDQWLERQRQKRRKLPALPPAKLLPALLPSDGRITHWTRERRPPRQRNINS